MSSSLQHHEHPVSVRGRILVVDDDQAILDLVVWSLEDEGYAIQAARDGVEALQLVKQQLPDLILLDLRMPRLSGWEFYRMLRSSETTASLPVVIMTADKSAVPSHPSLRGAQFLAKPFDLSDLLACIRSALPTNAQRARRD
jgi:two-component system, OmpR family, alkaline phosphatase synthesis response regulator PhoP